jgi:hypothetical protein
MGQQVEIEVTNIGSGAIDAEPVMARTGHVRWTVNFDRGIWRAVSTCEVLRTPQAAQDIQPMKPSLNPSVGGPVSAIGTLVRRTWLAQWKMPKRLACAVQVFSSHRRRETSRSASRYMTGFSIYSHFDTPLTVARWSSKLRINCWR